MLNRLEPTPALGLLHTEDVVPWLLQWSRSGYRAALVTVVGIEGGSPRSAGAQMAVSETGQFVGYLSGGCLERSVAAEALQCIRNGENKLVRYGKGSTYLDIRLPCGSGLDVYIDQALELSSIERLAHARETRSLIALKTSLPTGHSETVDVDSTGLRAPESYGDHTSFTRFFVPPLRLQLLGNGPTASAIARIGMSIGLDTEAAASDGDTLAELAHIGVRPHVLTRPKLPFSTPPDQWTAAVLVFHEHDWEPPILSDLLLSPCFYIGAVGSKRVHDARIGILRERGIPESALSRVRGQIGLIPGAKGRASLAIGVIGEIMSEAKARHFIA
jgi:xanthine dehydrogenase accessory factor